jgi:hypothetical protein
MKLIREARRARRSVWARHAATLGDSRVRTYGYSFGIFF